MLPFFIFLLYIISVESYFQPNKTEYNDIKSFLLNSMPKYDEIIMNNDSLNETITYSLLARSELSQLSEFVPYDIFKLYVTPYSNLDEPRDHWRKYLFDKYKKYVPKGPFKLGQISQIIFDLLNKVYEIEGLYFTANLSPVRLTPMETLTWGTASCTGLSIFAVDLLRSLGWPARVTGTIWNDDVPISQGDMNYNNHNWIEVYDPDNGGVFSFLDTTYANNKME